MFQKQIEYLSVLIFNVLFLGLPFVGFSLFGYCLVFGHITRYLAIAYILHMYYDKKHNEGIPRSADWFRLGFLFRGIISYFSVSIALTAVIPQDCNYIIGHHPHGFLAHSLFLYTIQERFEVMKKTFGKTRVALCTSDSNFSIPLLKDFLRAITAISVSESSITRRLTSAKSGNHVAIVLGGLDEAIITSPTEHRIVLNKRRGFCRIALKTGSHLLPTFAFGENQTYDTIIPPPGSFLKKVQKLLLQWFGVGVPILKGTWKYQYFFVMPRRSRIAVVFGKPIPVAKVANPTREEINELHAKYMSGLVELFDNNKGTYLDDKNAELIIE